METVLFQEAAAQGQTVMAAAGDSGSSDCYNRRTSTDQRLWVDDPSDQPNVTGVGGTSLTSEASTPIHRDRMERRIECRRRWGGRGRRGSVESRRQSWQLGYENHQYLRGIGHAAVPGGARRVGVVGSLTTVMSIFFGGRWTIFGGTSAAAPLWAALTAVTNQGCATPAGFLNPRLYAAGAGPSPPFNDITHGTTTCSAQPDYPAGADTTWRRGGSPRGAEPR